MLRLGHPAILLTCIKWYSVLKTDFLSFWESPFYAGFTVSTTIGINKCILFQGVIEGTRSAFIHFCSAMFIGPEAAHQQLPATVLTQVHSFSEDKILGTNYISSLSLILKVSYSKWHNVSTVKIWSLEVFWIPTNYPRWSLGDIVLVTSVCPSISLWFNSYPLVIHKGLGAPRVLAEAISPFSPQNMVMLHIKLKGMKQEQHARIYIALCTSSTPGVGLKGQNMYFFWKWTCCISN